MNVLASHSMFPASHAAALRAERVRPRPADAPAAAPVESGVRRDGRDTQAGESAGSEPTATRAAVEKRSTSFHDAFLALIDGAMGAAGRVEAPRGADAAASPPVSLPQPPALEGVHRLQHLQRAAAIGLDGYGGTPSSLGLL